MVNRVRSAGGDAHGGVDVAHLSEGDGRSSAEAPVGLQFKHGKHVISVSSPRNEGAVECPLLVGVVAMTRANGVIRPVVVAVLPDPVPKSCHITVTVVVDASIVDLTSSKVSIVVSVSTVRNVAVIMSV